MKLNYRWRTKYVQIEMLLCLPNRIPHKANIEAPVPVELSIADVQPAALAPGWGNCPREDFDIWRQICRIILWIIIELNK
jgi:hypothetical protein